MRNEARRGGGITLGFVLGAMLFSACASTPPATRVSESPPRCDSDIVTSQLLVKAFSAIVEKTETGTEIQWIPSISNPERLVMTEGERLIDTASVKLENAQLELIPEGISRGSGSLTLKLENVRTESHDHKDEIQNCKARLHYIVTEKDNSGGLIADTVTIERVSYASQLVEDGNRVLVNGDLNEVIKF